MNADTGLNADTDLFLKCRHLVCRNSVLSRFQHKSCSDGEKPPTVDLLIRGLVVPPEGTLSPDPK